MFIFVTEPFGALFLDMEYSDFVKIKKGDAVVYISTGELCRVTALYDRDTRIVASKVASAMPETLVGGHYTQFAYIGTWNEAMQSLFGYKRSNVHNDLLV